MAHKLNNLYFLSLGFSFLICLQNNTEFKVNIPLNVMMDYINCIESFFYPKMFQNAEITLKLFNIYQALTNLQDLFQQILNFQIRIK